MTTGDLGKKPEATIESADSTSTNSEHEALTAELRALASKAGGSKVRPCTEPRWNSRQLNIAVDLRSQLQKVARQNVLGKKMTPAQQQRTGTGHT